MLARTSTVFVAALALLACSDLTAQHGEPKRVEATCDRPMEPGVVRYSENSSNEVSSRLLGVANIVERDLDQSRRRLSVELIVFDPTTKDERHHKLAAGGVVAIGADEYCLIEVVEGKGNTLGWVSLRKLEKAAEERATCGVPMDAVVEKCIETAAL